MAEPRQPQDHKPKAKKPEETSEYFTFTANGQQYTMPRKTTDVITVGFVRRNRGMDEADFLLLALEKLSEGDESILDAIDAMNPFGGDWVQLQKDFKAHGVSLGE